MWAVLSSHLGYQLVTVIHKDVDARALMPERLSKVALDRVSSAVESHY